MRFERPKTSFARLAWGVLLFNIVVIIWGGFVSASGAGDGCGESWPLCAEEAARNTTAVETFIELFHRATSGLALLAVFYLLYRAFKTFPKSHVVRSMALLSTVFIIIEALIGALIVVFGLVAENESLARAFTQPFHLVNTYLLLGCLGLTAWWGAGNQLPKPNWGWDGIRPILIAAVGVLLISAFGTIAALASTIFPSDSFVAGLAKDFAGDSHYLIRLRVLHPLLAVVVGLYLVLLCRRIEKQLPGPLVGTLTNAIMLLYAIQFAMGSANAILLAPIWLSLLHLLVSDIIWLCLVWLGATVLAIRQPTAQEQAVAVV